jgi:hypothetical protein
MVLAQEAISSIKELITEELRKSWEAQGHNMTGKVIDELEWVVEEETDRIVVELWMLGYGVIIDRGVKASNIPFSGTGQEGGKSKYIEGLTRYAEKRMSLPRREALSVAFAIAYTHKKEGLPSRGSYRFSSTGKRKEWATDVFRGKETFIREQLKKIFTKVFRIRIEDKLGQIIKEFNTMPS